MPAQTLLSTTVIGIREDLEDMIYNTSPTDTPFVSAMDRTTCDNTLHEWQIDRLRAPGANTAAEGADAVYAAQTQPKRANNRTQIVQDTISVSGTTEAVRKAGRKNNSEIQRLSMKKMIELKKDVEFAAVGNGTLTSGATRQMRGLYGWIATNSDSGAGGSAPDPDNNVAPVAGTARTVTEALFKSALQTMYTSGGNVEGAMALVSPSHKVIYSGFTANVVRQQNVNATGSQDITVHTAFTFYGSDFGTVKVVPDRVMSVTGAGLQNTDYVLDMDQWALATLNGRGFSKTELAKTGDADNYQILTEVTLVSRSEAASAAIRDLSA